MLFCLAPYLAFERFDDEKLAAEFQLLWNIDGCISPLSGESSLSSSPELGSSTVLWVLLVGAGPSSPESLSSELAGGANMSTSSSGVRLFFIESFVDFNAGLAAVLGELMTFRSLAGLSYLLKPTGLAPPMELIPATRPAAT